jgi:hypothetical protein
MNFNNLTNAEIERLAILSEEMGEAIQIIGKILRHGYETHHPNEFETNRQLLEKELGDVRYSMIALCEKGDLSKENIHKRAEDKRQLILKYLHYNK